MSHLATRCERPVAIDHLVSTLPTAGKIRDDVSIRSCCPQGDEAAMVHRSGFPVHWLDCALVAPMIQAMTPDPRGVVSGSITKVFDSMVA